VFKVSNKLPELHPLWSWFKRFAKVNGISLTHKDDWEPWWDCFLTGARANREYEIGQHGPQKDDLNEQG
jgi:hypothetical protein